MSGDRQLTLDLGHRPAFGRDDFLVAPGNREAVEWIDRWPRWIGHALAIFGPAGCGKTHLVHVFALRAGARVLSAADVTIANVPALVDLARNEDERKLLAMMVSGASIGRSIVSPPGQPADRVSTLRAAFRKTLEDKPFAAEMKKFGLELDPLPGEELQKIIEEIAMLPPELVARARVMTK